MAFQEGFFAGPALEERDALMLSRKREQRVDFTWSEKPLRDFAVCSAGCHLLDVDAEFMDPAEGKNGARSRMRDVERDRVFAKRRFSECAVVELDPLSRPPSVCL